MNPMKLFKIFRKSNTCSPTPNQIVRRQSFIDYLLNNKKYSLAARQTINYYCITAPLSDGIDRLTTNISSIPPLIWDKKENLFVENHPLEQLLQNPNFEDTWKEFATAFSTFLLLTGDNYMIANSLDMNGEPRQLFIVPPQTVDRNIGLDNLTLSYNVNYGAEPIKYNLVKTLTGDRYLATLPNGVVSELYHSMVLNPLTAYYKIKGKSPIGSLYYEIEQYIASNIHNLSRLKRGTTLDGVFTYPEKLKDDEYNELKAQVEEYWSGECNAGKPFILEGGLEFQSNPKDNKDMDYDKLDDRLTTKIYNKLRIPLSFISKETMNLANMESSRLRIYHEAVLPWTDHIFADLTKFLMPRYKNSENLIVWYDKGLISALEPERNEQLQAKQKLGVYTINEIRGMDRAEPIDGGQNVYGQASEVPIATDPEDEFTDGDELTQEPVAPANPQKMAEILKLYKDSEDKPLFAEDEINHIVKNFDISDVKNPDIKKAD
jgi:HK97 family phage portal protein